MKTFDFMYGYYNSFWAMNQRGKSYMKIVMDFVEES